MSIAIFLQILVPQLLLGKAPSLTHKYKPRLKLHTRDKHFGLVC